MAYRAFHGSPRNFKAFSKTARGGFGGSIGVRFASTFEAAAHFAREQFAGEQPVVFEAKLNLVNPKLFFGHSALVEEVRKHQKGGSIESGYKSLRRSLIRAGHDGLIVVGSDTDSGLLRDDFLVFDIKQITIVERLNPRTGTIL